ncbi:hypothetical protein FNV43_RR18012 [Rhamnella rubrinervis]|uniref:Uncharacterized protein n=1 Tax=Rhamnella rubrinervis TaxID=2594499 RepID=A0A8K0GVC4_9ROSA|nr:hypothetical protein FNV43_RR18012 [Rhamnella rubrinervis]
MRRQRPKAQNALLVLPPLSSTQAGPTNWVPIPVKWQSGKLTKLKSVLKKWNSFSKQSRSSVNSIASAEEDDDSSAISRDLHPVYVGKSRRRYLVGSDVVEHPLFRELVERSGDSNIDTINVSCEVVLFEHLLWMLENADPQPESLDELVEFYAC